MGTAAVSTSFQFNGKGYSCPGASISYETAVEGTKTLAALVAAQSGTLSTRTDNDTGVVTLSTGHGIVTSGAKVDVYWSGGMRYGMTATVSSNDVTIDGGAGDNLPAQSTSCTVCAQTTLDINFDGDLAQFIAVLLVNASDTGVNGHVDFQDGGNATIKEIDLVEQSANGGISKTVNFWEVANGDANAFTGNRVTTAYLSHDSTSASTVYVLVGHNST